MLPEIRRESTLFCTHLHPDHIGGLMRDGRSVFPKAVLRVHHVTLRI
jgi:glyoxylase-like metal-dependent hydrolase (beta-lactamase superfamily II)